MRQTQTTEQSKVIDLTGLPDKAVESVRTIVDAMRRQAANQSGSVRTAEWDKQFEAWMAEVAARADRYPENFVADDSREAIYEGRGE